MNILDTIVDKIKDIASTTLGKVGLIGAVILLGFFIIRLGGETPEDATTTDPETGETVEEAPVTTVEVNQDYVATAEAQLNAAIAAGTLVYGGNVNYLANAIAFGFDYNKVAETTMTQQDYLNKVKNGLTKLNTLFPTIVAMPEVTADEIIVLFDFCYKIDDFVSGKIDIPAEERQAVTTIVETYLDAETAAALLTTIQTTYGIDMQNTPEGSYADTNRYNAGYDPSYGPAEPTMTIEDDANKNGIPDLVLNKPYVLTPVNGVEYCYEYTGETTSLAYAKPPVDEAAGEVASPNPSYLYVYDDYEDCIKGSTTIAKNGNDGATTKSKNSYSVLTTDYTSTGPSNGMLEATEAGEVTQIETGQYVSVSNVIVYSIADFEKYLIQAKEEYVEGAGGER